MIYILLFVVPAVLLLFSEYRLRTSRARYPSYLPNEIYNLQRKWTNSRPLPPRKRFLRTLYQIVLRRPMCPPLTFNPQTQSKSSFLSAMPAEIRLEIYKWVIGNGRIHCVPLHKSVGYFSCPDAEKCNCQATVFGNGKYFQLWWNIKTLPAGKPSLEILRSCRQAYVEASDLFYTSNVFVINSLWTPGDLKNVVPTHRLRQIRKLSLNFSFGAHGLIPLMSPISQNPMHYPATDNAWIDAWKCLSEHFTGVEELTIVLEMRSLDLFIEHKGEAWMQPILETAKMPLKRCNVSLRGWDERFQNRVDEIPELERKLEHMLLQGT